MSKRRQHSELVWLKSHAGFSSGLSYAVLMPEPGYFHNPAFRGQLPPLTREERQAVATMEVTDPMPCMLDCDDPGCMEWNDVWLIPGDTRAEAITNLIARRYQGAAYHVSECQMANDQES